MSRYIFLAFVFYFLFSSSLHAYQLPQRTNDNIIVASYNIKWLGQTQHDLSKLAQVIEHFDICGILEIKNEKKLRDLKDALESHTGLSWGYAFGVRTHRPGGRYHEAYGVVWRKNRVELGDGVIGGIWDLEEAFRNDPYIISFKRRNFDFSLMLVHTRWSNDSDGSRANEVAMIAEQIIWMQGFLTDKDIILAGDFNYSGTAQHIKDMAEAANLTQIDPNRKTTFKNDFSDYASAYDHIFITSNTQREFNNNSSDFVDATKLVYGNNSSASMKSSKSELSDHLPVWATFNVSLPDDD